MKKFLTFPLIIMLLLTLTCCAKPYNFYKESDLDSVTISIIEIKGYIKSTYQNDVLREDAFNENSYTTLKLVNNTAKIVKDINALQCSRPPFGDKLTKITGKGVLINYPDGTIEIITDNGSAVINATSVTINTIGFNTNDFNKLLNTYLES